MKIFITCAVIALVAALVFVVAPSGERAGSPGVMRQEQVRTQALPPVEQLVAPETVAAHATDDVPAVVEEDAAPLFDVLPIYDAMLMLNFADDGSLLVDRNTLAALQTIYTALGQDAGSDGFAQLQSILEEAMPAAAASKLLEVAQQYFAYRQAEQDVRTAAEQQSHDPMHSYHQLVTLRRTYLGEGTAGRLFAEEETQVPYMTSAFAVARDRNLSEEVRAARLAELQEAFNHSASRMNSPLAYKVLEAKVARLREGGAAEPEIFAVREAVLGSAEAQRLAEEDRRRGDRRAREPGGPQ